MTHAPLALLLAYAIAFGAFALGGAALGFDDHPGQLYRVWHVVTHGIAPWRWNDGWWTGYPELQFYPPGVSYLAAALHAVTAGRLPVAAAYHAVVWLTYLAPGVTTYLLLSRVLGSGWLALPAAFVALTLSAGLASGVEGGVRIGMVAARLGWALIPLLALALHRWLDGRQRLPPLAAMVVATIVLVHPAHVPVAVALVALAAIATREDRSRRGAAAASTLVIAASLTAFWSVPLVARLAHTRALAWGDFSFGGLAGALLRDPLLASAVALAAIAPRVARTPMELTLARLPWVMAGVVAFDAGVLERLGVRSLPADRVLDSAWLAVVLAAGLVAGRSIEIASRRASAPAPALALGALVVTILLSLPQGTVSLWPRAHDWPSLAATSRGLRLHDLWTALSRAPEGRVLFVRSGVPLVYGTAWWRPHTHVTALAPLLAGRAIVHGTFTHPSPVAALVYRGSADGGAITALAETLDGRSLFGRPLDELGGAALNDRARRLRASTIVAVEDDAVRLSALDRDPGLVRLRVAPPFVAWTRREPVEMPRPVGPGRWSVRVPGEPATWVSAGLAYYPLWRATDGGASIATRRGVSGDLEVLVTRRDATVELTYAPAAPEIAGLIVSAGGLAVWLGLAYRTRAQRARSV